MSSEALILAFDCSAAHCAAALVRGDEVLASYEEPMPRGQAERLPPLIAGLLSETGTTLDAVAAIGVGVGPGNFTGTRIAVAHARGLALGLGVPAIGVTLFEALPEGTSAQWVAVPVRAGLWAVAAAGSREAARARLVDDDGLVTAIDAPVVTLPPTELPAALGQARIPPALPLAVAIARVAGRRPADQPRPRPLYLRPPDAAPPADAAPPLLP